MNKEAVPISISTNGQSSENELLRNLFSRVSPLSTTMAPGKKEEVPLSSREYSGLMDLLMQGRNSKTAKQLSIAGGESLQLLNAINNMQPTHPGSVGSVPDVMAHVGNPLSPKEGMNMDELWLGLKKEMGNGVEQSQVSSLRREVDNGMQRLQGSALRREANNGMQQSQMNPMRTEVNNPVQQSLINPIHTEVNSPIQQSQMNALQQLNTQQSKADTTPFDSREHIQPLRPRFRNSLQPRFSRSNLWGSQPSARNGDVFRGNSFDLCVAFSFPPSANRNETDMKRMLRGVNALGPAVLPILLDTGDSIPPCSHEFLCGTKLPVNRHGVLYVQRMLAQIEAILTQYQITCPFLAIANPGVFFGVELLDVLKLVRKLVRDGYVSEQVVLVGRDVSVQNQPDFEHYAQSMKRLYETTPFNSPFSMVETPSC